MSLTQPEEKHGGGSHIYTWDDLGVKIVINRIRNSTYSPDGMMSVALRNGAGNYEKIHGGHIKITHVSHRETHTRILKRMYESQKEIWELVIHASCILTDDWLQMADPGEDAASLDNMQMKKNTWLLDPFIMEGEVNLLYGDGGAFKSYLALAMSLAIQQDRDDIVGIAPGKKAMPLILDWETNLKTQGQRLLYICNGVPSIDEPHMPYLRLHGPISNHLDRIIREKTRWGSELIIVDSLSYACGGEINKDEAASMMETAQGEIGGTWLVIGHTPRGEKNLRGVTMWRNWGRNSWYLVKDGDPDAESFNITLFHDKSNNARGQRPQAFKITFDKTISAVNISRADAQSTDAFEEAASQRVKIIGVLMALNRPLYQLEIAEGTGLSLIKVQKKLFRMKGVDVVSLEDGKWGLIQR